MHSQFNGSLNVFKLFPTISSYKLPSIRPSGALWRSWKPHGWLKFNKVGVFPGQTTCCWMLTLNNNWMRCSFSRLQGFHFRRYKFVSAQMLDIRDRSGMCLDACLWLLVDIFIVWLFCSVVSTLRLPSSASTSTDKLHMSSQKSLSGEKYKLCSCIRSFHNNHIWSRDEGPGKSC